MRVAWLGLAGPDEALRTRPGGGPRAPPCAPLAQASRPLPPARAPPARPQEQREFDFLKDSMLRWWLRSGRKRGQGPGGLGPRPAPADAWPPAGRVRVVEWRLRGPTTAEERREGLVGESKDNPETGEFRNAEEKCIRIVFVTEGI